jgi:hypothetical protein
VNRRLPSGSGSDSFGALQTARIDEHGVFDSQRLLEYYQMRFGADF